MTLNMNYLGRLGLFGAYSAQEKYNSVEKFLNNETLPLDPAAKQGELGKLIKSYQDAQDIQLQPTRGKIWCFQPDGQGIRGSKP